MKSLLPLVTLFLCLSTCSGMNVIGEMMMDAGNGNAQTANKTMSAATDAARLEAGVTTVGISMGVTVATGPIMMTSLVRSMGSTLFVYFAAESGTCDAIALPTFEVPLQGLTMVYVKNGQRLCASGNSGAGGNALSWSGYRPY